LKENEINVDFNEVGKKIEEAIKSLKNKKLQEGDLNFDPSMVETRLSFKLIDKDNWQIIVELIDTNTNEPFHLPTNINI
jgi:replicative superfamily II helicase